MGSTSPVKRSLSSLFLRPLTPHAGPHDYHPIRILSKKPPHNVRNLECTSALRTRHLSLLHLVLRRPFPLRAYSHHKMHCRRSSQAVVRSGKHSLALVHSNTSWGTRVRYGVQMQSISLCTQQTSVVLGCECGRSTEKMLILLPCLTTCSLTCQIQSKKTNHPGLAWRASRPNYSC
jgi:hypothetical protein